MILGKNSINLLSTFLFTAVTTLSPFTFAEGETPASGGDTPKKAIELDPETKPFYANSVSQVEVCSKKEQKLTGNDCNKDTNTSLLAGSAVVGDQASSNTAEATKGSAQNAQVGGATTMASMNNAKQQCESSFFSCNDSCSEAKKTIQSDAETCFNNLKLKYELANNPNAATIAKQKCEASANKLNSSANSSRNKCYAMKAAFVGLALLALKGLMDYMKKSKEVEKQASSDPTKPPGGSGTDTNLPNKFCREGDLKCICTSSKASSDKRCGCFDVAGSSNAPNDRCMCQKYGNEDDTNTAYRCSERGIKPIVERLVEDTDSVITTNNSSGSSGSSTNNNLVNVQGSSNTGSGQVDRDRPGMVSGMVASVGSKGGYDESIEHSPIRNPSNAAGETGSSNNQVGGAMVAGASGNFGSFGSGGSSSNYGVGETGSGHPFGVSAGNAVLQAERNQVASAHGPSIFQLVRTPYSKYSQKMLP